MTIHVRNWEKFQHRDVVRAKQGRAPVWIKLYTELLSDEAFLALTEHRRLLLISVWLEYARTRARLPLDIRSLSRRLQLRVTTADLEALNHAGFIEYQPAASQQPASLEERREEQTVRSNGSVDVAAPLNLEELEGEESSTGVVVELDSRRDPQTRFTPFADGVREIMKSQESRAEVNGRPLGPILDELLRRGETG